MQHVGSGRARVQELLERDELTTVAHHRRGGRPRALQTRIVSPSSASTQTDPQITPISPHTTDESPASPCRCHSVVEELLSVASEVRELELEAERRRDKIRNLLAPRHSPRAIRVVTPDGKVIYSSNKTQCTEPPSPGTPREINHRRVHQRRRATWSKHDIVSAVDAAVGVWNWKHCTDSYSRFLQASVADSDLGRRAEMPVGGQKRPKVMPEASSGASLQKMKSLGGV